MPQFTDRHDSSAHIDALPRLRPFFPSNSKLPHATRPGFGLFLTLQQQGIQFANVNSPNLCMHDLEFARAGVGCY